MTPSLGPLVQSYFIDHLPVQKGLRVGSIRSYRDTIRLFLCFVSGQRRSSISSLTLDDLTFERVLAFLKHLAESGTSRAARRPISCGASAGLSDSCALRNRAASASVRCAALHAARSSANAGRSCKDQTETRHTVRRNRALDRWQRSLAERLL